MDEKNEVLLLEPISTKPNTKEKVDPKASYLGGSPSFYPDDTNISSVIPKCSKCNQVMNQIIQVYAPLEGLERTLYIFGCNNAACLSDTLEVEGIDCSGATGNNAENYRFHVGGAGVFKCLRSQTIKAEEDTEASDGHEGTDSIDKNKNLSSEIENECSGGGWGAADDEDGGWGDMTDNDWGDSFSADEDKSANDKDMNELEAMLSAIEAGNDNKVSSSGKRRRKKETDDKQNEQIGTITNDISNCFPRYDLDVYEEPECHDDDDSDEEDIVVTSKESDVQKLLAKYLKEEEDSEIVSAINNPCGNNKAGNGGTNGNDNAGEKYERLPPLEKAFMTFTSRVRRAPSQCARYAYAQQPIWSIPLPLTKKGKRGGQSRDLSFPEVPLCKCGATREFECQLMPSILHTVNVDKYARNISKVARCKNDNELDMILSKNVGGMNWGTIAVYSCSDSCDYEREEFIVVQESADGNPKRREMKIAKNLSIESKDDF